MKSIYINPEGVACYLPDCPEEPSKTESSYREFSIEYYMAMYQKALTAAKQSAVPFVDQGQAKEIVHQTRPVLISDFFVYPLPSSWKVGIMDAATARIFSTGNKHKTMPLRGQVAVLIPPPTSEQKEDPDKMFKEWIGDSQAETQDDLWAELLKAMCFFPAPKYLIEVKEQFTISRKNK